MRSMRPEEAADQHILDLLDAVESDDDEAPDSPKRASKAGTASTTPATNRRANREADAASDSDDSTGFDFATISARGGAAFQEIVDQFCVDNIYGLKVSFTVSDPNLEDCPLVACSIGFSELTGYAVHEIVGRNCRLLLDGVPPEHINNTTRLKARRFCQSMKEGGGVNYKGSHPELPEGVQNPWVGLAEGEMICVQINARKSGELFRNMFYLKDVELEERHFILGLQAELPEDFEETTSMQELEKRCHAAFSQLCDNMTQVEQVLASQFWYSAPMRRQQSAPVRA